MSTRAALATDPPEFVNLDMEEYRDLDLTVAVVHRACSTSREFARIDAGIVLQAYLPDSHAVLEHLGEWAAARVAGGGAPIKVRLVKGANLAMERVEAELHGWAQAPYATKAEVDASYKRAARLGAATRSGPARCASASPATTCSTSRGRWCCATSSRSTSARGSRSRCSRAWRRRRPGPCRPTAGGLLLYCPVVRDDELDASLAYLSRRLDENTAPENFLRALFTLTPGLGRVRRAGRAVPRGPSPSGTTVDRDAPSAPVAASPAPTGRSPTSPTPTSPIAAAATRCRRRQPGRRCRPRRPAVPSTTTSPAIDAVVARRAAPPAAWAATRTVAERRRAARPVADVMAAERGDDARGDGRRGGQDGARGRPRGVSEAIDFARYYGGRHRAIDGRRRGAGSRRVAWSSWRRRGTSRTPSPPAACSPRWRPATR